MSDSNQSGLMAEVMDIMTRGQAPWQQSEGELVPGAESINIPLESLPGKFIIFNNSLGMAGAEIDEGNGIVTGFGSKLAFASYAKEFSLSSNDVRNFLKVDALADQYRGPEISTLSNEQKLLLDFLDEKIQETGINELNKGLTPEHEQQPGIGNADALPPKGEFAQLVSGQHLTIETAVDDGMSYVGTVAGEDGGTVIVKVGDHRAVAMSKARMEGDVEVGENSRFGYEKQYGHDERGRAIRDKNVELGGQRYAVIDMDDLVQQNRRSIMGKVVGIESDAIYTKFGKDAEGQEQVVAHNPAKLDTVPALGSFATINYGTNGLGKLLTREQSKGIDQQIER